jgi:hypothetical protein
MLQYQYELFEEIPDELGLMHKEIESMRLSLDKQRKSLFAKDMAKGKDLIELKEEIHKLRFELDGIRKMIS